MRLVGVQVSNFRAILAATIDIEPLTAIIGANNTGKSAFLKAIDLFFSNAPKIDDDDFHSKNIEEPIDITLSFADLTEDEMTLFESNLIDSQLTVTRRLIRGNPKESGSFFVEALVNPDFSACRNEESKRARTELYKELQKQFDGLDNIKSADEIDAQLEKWEANNKDKLKRQRVGSFRGWKNVAIGQLKRKTDFVFIPAVRDASEDTDEARSPVKQLVDTLAKQTIENNQEFKDFTAATNERLKKFTDPTNVSALANISEALSAILKQYYAESDLIATWQPISEFPVVFPSSEIAVKDHGFQSNVERVGHGLQRAIIITILEFLARERLRNPEQKEKEFKKPESDIIVAIEEPEIYQHPIKQRHISNVLGELTSSFSAQTGIRIQIVLATHSPLFVHLPRFQEIRMARRSPEEPNDVVVSKLTISECSAGLAKFHDPVKKPMGDAAFASKLHIFDADLSEGFFSKKIVLVEGPSDKSILEAALTIQGRSAMAEGLTILAVGGKKILDKPAYIFNALGIPTYVILDNDNKSAKDKVAEAYYNKFLQRVLGVPEDKIVDWPAGIFDRWAAWDGNIENYISTTCGAELYDKVKLQMMTDFEVDGEDCVKSPAIAAAMLTAFAAQGIKFENLNKIIEMVDSL